MKRFFALFVIISILFALSASAEKIAGRQMFDDFTILVPPMDFELSYDGGNEHRTYEHRGKDAAKIDIKYIGEACPADSALEKAVSNGSMSEEEYTYSTDNDSYATEMILAQPRKKADYDRMAVFFSNGHEYSIEWTHPEGKKISFGFFRKVWEPMLKSIELTEGISDGNPNDISNTVTEPVDTDGSIEHDEAPAEQNDVVYVTLEKGSKGDEVRALQQRLIDLFYLGGKADGDYGSKTKAGVERFQEASGLDVTGVADPATQAMLFSDDAPSLDISFSCSLVAVGSQSTCVWDINGKEVTLHNNQSKVFDTEWGMIRFYGNGTFERAD